MTQRFYTIGQLAEQFHEPEWKLRRIIDSLGVGVPRAGQYRLVPASLLPSIEAKLQNASAKE